MSTANPIYLTPAWIETYVKDHPDDIMVSPFVPAFLAMLAQHSAALTLCKSTQADNVKALATEQWAKSDSADAKQYASMMDVIREAESKLALIKAEADALADKGIPAFVAAAEEYAQTHGAMAKQSEASSRTLLGKLIDGVPGTRAVAFPPVESPDRKGTNKGLSLNGEGSRGRKAGSLDWHLASATDNGQAISFTGDNITLSIVAKHLGITRDGLDDMLRHVFNGNIQSPAPNVTTSPVVITTASGAHTLTFTGRETKPRGRKAGSKNATTTPATPESNAVAPEVIAALKDDTTAEPTTPPEVQAAE